MTNKELEAEYLVDKLAGSLLYRVEMTYQGETMRSYVSKDELERMLAEGVRIAGPNMDPLPLFRAEETLEEYKARKEQE
jgi:hypothetical protein